jgi:hypothetical protein
MFIKCSGEHAFGGRTSDIFYIENMNSLDELDEYVTNKVPIKCKEPDTFYKWNIAAQEQMPNRLVYLNNYLKISKIHYYLMNKEERKYIYDNICKGCSMDNEALSSALRCSYVDDGKGGCKNYEESYVFSLVEWIKSKFK